MLDSKNFKSVIYNLENNNEEFVSALDRVIRFGVNIVNNIEELRKEILDYDEIYQIFITDSNFNFWIKVSNGTLLYKKGINRKASFRVRYKKKIFINILKHKMYGTDAFMRGKVKIDGTLTQGLKFIKLFRLFIKYMENGMDKI